MFPVCPLVRPSSRVNEAARLPDRRPRASRKADITSPKQFFFIGRAQGWILEKQRLCGVHVTVRTMRRWIAESPRRCPLACAPCCRLRRHCKRRHDGYVGNRKRGIIFKGPEASATSVPLTNYPKVSGICTAVTITWFIFTFA